MEDKNDTTQNTENKVIELGVEDAEQVRGGALTYYGRRLASSRLSRYESFFKKKA